MEAIVNQAHVGGAMIPAGTKTRRLHEMETLLLEHPEGLTQADIARQMGLHRSTIYRYLPDLPFLCADERGRLTIDRASYLLHVRMSLHEATAVHLAARMMATRMDKQNPHAAAALRKLALALEKLAPRASRDIARSADMLDAAQKKRDPAYLAVLETLTLAWAGGYKTRVEHTAPGAEPKEFLFSPYVLEPYAIGQSLYAIGWREPPGELRTLKVERIARACLLAERYTIPADFDPCALLADAWGIWYTGQPPVTVVLRFSPRVAGRVSESCWHPGEQLEPQADGSLVWRANIAEPLEMMPWVRGWGADCEVLAPAGMRESVAHEVQRLSQLYQQDEGKR
ncbi:MAG: WYL domain-containing protein [Anaerolineaceae bacterium]|nr:WYL domain-containing protein [Anaerolineaceae bacterium]